MAKNDSSARVSKNVLGFLSFAAIIIVAILRIISAINNLFKLSINTGILSLIEELALLFVILWSGWTFAKGCKKLWRTIYLVLVVVIIIGFVLGLI